MPAGYTPGARFALVEALVDRTDDNPPPIDDADREMLLMSLLSAHPGAVASAVDDDGRLVALPSSVDIAEQQVVSTRSAMELVAAASRSTLIENWERAKKVGASSVPVTLVNGTEAICHIFDVRRRHGVLIGVIVADSQTDLVVALADRPHVVPKTGRIDKDDVAMILRADDRICEILNYKPDELVGTRSLELVHPDDRQRAIDAWIEMLMTPGNATRLRARHRRSDGSWIWMELTNSNFLERSEGCIVTEMIDISDEMAAVEALRQREQLLARLAEALPSGVLHIDRERNVVYSNARLHHLVGIDRSSTVDEQLASVIPEDRDALAAALDRVLIHGRDADVEARLRVDGHTFIRRCAIAVRALTGIDNEPAGAVICVDDITDAFAVRAELERRATVDELTGCLNRAAALDELERALHHHLEGSPGTAVVFLDLDGFKEVNDTFGHKAGDQLLASAAARLRGAMRDRDIIGRLGGDEFLVVLPGIHHIDEATQIVTRLAGALTESLEVVAGLSMRIRSSIGVAWSGSPDITADALVAAADRAMYESKRTGRCEPVMVNV